MSVKQESFKLILQIFDKFLERLHITDKHLFAVEFKRIFIELYKELSVATVVSERQ